MVATRSKTFSDSKRGNFEEDDVQMPLKLVKELLKQQESCQSLMFPTQILLSLFSLKFAFHDIKI